MCRQLRHLTETVTVDSDVVWCFVFDLVEDAWTWRRESKDGEVVARSREHFLSLDACVADAEASGFPLSALGGALVEPTARERY
jgi:hypothetical protein